MSDDDDRALIEQTVDPADLLIMTQEIHLSAPAATDAEYDDDADVDPEDRAG